MKWYEKLFQLLSEWFTIPPSPPIPQPPVENLCVDDIDPRLIAWDEPKSPSAWPITAKILKASITKNGMTAEYEGTKNWPVRPDGGRKESIGNWWLIAKTEDNKWHAATTEWLGRGKTRVTGKRWDGTDAIHGPLGFWSPKSGETVGVMLSTVARGAPFTIEERSNIKAVVIP